MPKQPFRWPDDTPRGYGYTCEVQGDDGALLYPPAHSYSWSDVREYLKAIIPAESVSSMEWVEVGRYERVCYLEPNPTVHKGRRWIRLRRVAPLTNQRVAAVLCCTPLSVGETEEDTQPVQVQRPSPEQALFESSPYLSPSQPNGGTARERGMNRRMKQFADV